MQYTTMEQAVLLLGQGMAGIFAVLGLIAAAVWLLARLDGQRSPEE